MIKSPENMDVNEKLDRVIFSYATNISGLEEENKVLRESVVSLEKEIEKFKRAPLIACEVRDLIEEKALIRLPNGNEFLVEVTGPCSPVKPGDGVLVEQKNLAVVQKMQSMKRFDVERFVVMNKPMTSWGEIGGLQEQIRDLKEVIELPMTKPQLFKDVGIHPPKGVLLYGPPGTGKTLLAKAVAASTNSTFIEIVGSELVQKFIGEGAKLVREVFQLAREKAPAIVFIDELDAIAATRIDVGTSGEREVQRTFMQLLAEIDGFEPLDNVKIIGCTNRRDIVDPAVLRPGRIDRLVYVPLPDETARTQILKIHTIKMNLDKKIHLPDLAKETAGLSGAELRALCTEAGYSAIRENRSRILHEDFASGLQKMTNERFDSDTSYMSMFG